MCTNRHSDIILHLMTIIMAAFIVLAGFAPTVYADMGPKPSVAITITNAPSDEYYLAMLYENDGLYREYTYNDSLSPEENAVISTIYDYEEDGYIAFMNATNCYYKSCANHYYYYGHQLHYLRFAGAVEVTCSLASILVINIFYSVRINYLRCHFTGRKTNIITQVTVKTITIVIVFSTIVTNNAVSK